MIAYLLISLQERNEEEVKDALKQFSEIEEAHMLFGEWDIIAKVNSENPEIPMFCIFKDLSVARITPRSMVFFNARIFPGHSYASSCFNALGLSFIPGLLYFLQK